MIIQAKDHSGDLVLRTEILVVGSGAGGAVVAKELAEAGFEVIIIEEGPYIPPEVYAKYRPTEALRKMSREAGTTAAIPIGDTPTIGLQIGKVVGGSSVLTGGVCFRLPEWVTDMWVKQYGLKDYSPKGLELAYNSVEHEVSVEDVPLRLRSKSTTIFAEASKKMGAELKPMRRNVPNCAGKSVCNFGCPTNAKLSVDVTYLKKAYLHNARVYSNCRADKVFFKNGRAGGVVGRVLNGPFGEPSGKLTVYADTVVLCAGSMHTPQILSKSKVGLVSGQLGRNISLHPGLRVSAYFDEEIRGWEGAMQSAYTDYYEDEGITLVSIFAPLNVVAATSAGVGSGLLHRVNEINHVAMFGALIHDESVGRLWMLPTREPLLTYKMAPRDKASMVKSIKILTETYLQAGAKEVFLPIFGSEPIKNIDDLKKITTDIPARFFETVAFHPLGSVRMGNSPEYSVVSPDGKVHEVEGLYVADGSIFPSSIGVNSQLPIMTVATRIAWKIRDKKKKMLEV